MYAHSGNTLFQPEMWVNAVTLLTRGFGEGPIRLPILGCTFWLLWYQQEDPHLDDQPYATFLPSSLLSIAARPSPTGTPDDGTVHQLAEWIRIVFSNNQFHPAQDRIGFFSSWNPPNQLGSQQICFVVFDFLKGCARVFNPVWKDNCDQPSTVEHRKGDPDFEDFCKPFHGTLTYLHIARAFAQVQLQLQHVVWVFYPTAHYHTKRSDSGEIAYVTARYVLGPDIYQEEVSSSFPLDHVFCHLEVRQHILTKLGLSLHLIRSHFMRFPEEKSKLQRRALAAFLTMEQNKLLKSTSDHLRGQLEVPCLPCQSPLYQVMKNLIKKYKNPVFQPDDPLDNQEFNDVDTQDDMENGIPRGPSYQARVNRRGKIVTAPADSRVIVTAYPPPRKLPIPRHFHGFDDYDTPGGYPPQPRDIQRIYTLGRGPIQISRTGIPGFAESGHRMVKPGIHFQAPVAPRNISRLLLPEPNFHGRPPKSVRPTLVQDEELDPATTVALEEYLSDQPDSDSSEDEERGISDQEEEEEGNTDRERVPWGHGRDGEDGSDSDSSQGDHSSLDSHSESSGSEGSLSSGENEDAVDPIPIPTGSPPPEPETRGKTNVLLPGTSMDGRKRYIKADGFLSLKPTQLAQIADEWPENRQKPIFLVNGIYKRNVFKVDVEGDRAKLDETEVEIRYDIDSLMVVSHDLHLQGLVYVRAVKKQEYGSYRTFTVSNNVKVGLLEPMSDPEIAQGDRLNYKMKNTPIAHIPHLLFASKHPVYFYIFFPRLIRKQEDNPSAFDTTLPVDVEEMFFSLLNWCVLSHQKGSGKDSYYSQTIHELAHREAGKKANIPDYKLPAEDLTSILSLLREVIQSTIDQVPVEEDTDEDWVYEDSLQLFKSFFFVADVRAIKLHTMIAMRPDTEVNLLGKLMGELSVLDFQAISDTTKTCVYVDLAICFTPKRIEGNEVIPLVGLWNMDKVKYSLLASGGIGVQKHPLANLPKYGNVDCSMDTVSRERTGILKWQFYCLYYELVRAKRSEIHTPSLNEAYCGGDTLAKAANGLINVLRGGRDKNYGVRLEIRMGWHTALDFLKHNNIITFVRP